MSIEMFRMSRQNVTRLFVGAILAVVAGLVLGCAALFAALASDAIDLGGSDYARRERWIRRVDRIGARHRRVAGGPGQGTIAAVVSWIGALLNTWQLEDKMWFGLLLAGAARLGRRRDDRLRRPFGPDGTKQSVARPGSAGAART